MKRRRCSIIVVVAVVFSIGIVGASAGGACVPQPLVLVEPRPGLVAGNRVTVDGFRFASGPVEVRWTALDGPLLASTNGPSFTVEVDIPRVEPGMYSIVALSRTVDGSVGGLISQVGVQVGPGGTANVGSDKRLATTTTGGSSLGPILLGVSAIVLLVGGWFAGTRWSRRRAKDDSRSEDGAGPLTTDARAD